jgi:hypothetical protein
MASTYPLEVVTADRWASTNKNLKGDQLKTAVDQQNWDDSVKALVATPDVLSMMSTQLAWTENLGDAVLAQQPDIMDAIQRLRARAQAQNKLQSTSQQKVSVEQVQGKQVTSSRRPSPTKSMSRITMRRSCTDHGPIQLIRPIIFRRPAILPERLSPRALLLALAIRWVVGPQGGTIGAEESIGAATTSP